MNEHKKLIAITAVLSVFVIALIAFDFIRDTKTAGATAPSGLQATVATSTLYSVGTTAAKVFATSTCAARIVTTVEKPIMITFTDKKGDSPTAIHGHYQAASTTIAYDGGLYGCDAWKIYGHDATSIITVTETQ